MHETPYAIRGLALWENHDIMMISLNAISGELREISLSGYAVFRDLAITAFHKRGLS